MYTFTLEDARASDAFKDVSGVCSSSPEFVDLLNRSMRRLMKRGNWFGTEILARFCLYNGCLTLPRYIGTLLGLRFCNGEQRIRNHWYEIVGPHNCATHPGDFSRTTTEIGTTPLFNEITGGNTGKFVRGYVTQLEDVGKTFTLFGEDSNGQPLQQKKAGAWVQGIEFTLVNPYVQTPIRIRRITSVVREMTQANIQLFEYDSVSNTQRPLAVYEPSETNPRYRKYSIPNFACIPTGCPTENGVQLKMAEALVKLAFVPVVAENDFLAIDDFDAIAFMMQAIRLESANQDDQSEGKILKAVREMNFTERDKLPGPQTTVRVNPVGRQISNPM